MAFGRVEGVVVSAVSVVLPCLCLAVDVVSSTTATDMGRIDSSLTLATPITVAIRIDVVVVVVVVGKVAPSSWTISSSVNNGKAFGNSIDVRSQPIGCCSSSIVVIAVVVDAAAFR